MEYDILNESVRPLFLLLALADTKRVARIVLRFICFLAYAHILFKFITLGFQR